MDYEDAGDKSMLHLSGQAAPGTRIMLYVDDQFNGIATSDATGTWSFSGNKQLTPGNHALRADLLDKDTTKVIARAEVKFDRTAPSRLARAEEDDAKAAAALKADTALKNDSSAGAGDRQGEATTTATGSADSASDTQRPRVIVVRSGDTLWQIAQRHYGDGAKYTQIFRSNRQQIRDPNWIYPSQRFELPQ